MIAMSLSEAANVIDASITGVDAIFTGCSTDSRSVRPGNLFIALRGERYNGHNYVEDAIEQGAAGVMVESDVDVAGPVLTVPDTMHAMARLSGYWRRRFDIPLIAITGSNGKTTVKEMVKTILSQKTTVLSTRGNLNNHIGVPLTLFEMGNQHGYAVVEMGANHAGEISMLSRLASPTVAVITLCAPAHLEGFGSEEGVACAKAEIYEGLVAEGIAIINADDKYSGLWRESAGGHRYITFGLTEQADVYATNVCFDAETGKTRFTLHIHEQAVETFIHLPGKHNVQNAIAAAACCLAAGISVADIRTGLEVIEPIQGRMQLRVTTGGIRIFDDTYNANPGSLKAGLQVLSSCPGECWLVLGDMGELGKRAEQFHREAGTMAREYGVTRLLAIGELCRHAVTAFGNGGSLFQNHRELATEIGKYADGNLTLLVKGSRAMTMENIINILMVEN